MFTIEKPTASAYVNSNKIAEFTNHRTQGVRHRVLYNFADFEFRR